MGKKGKKKKFHSINKEERIHNSICEAVANEIHKRFNYDHIETNVNYKLGECDVYATNPNREVYYEIKIRHYRKNLEKAKHQTCRWTKYMKDKYPQKDFYGVYYTNKLVKIVSKNGKAR